MVVAGLDDHWWPDQTVSLTLRLSDDGASLTETHDGRSRVYARCPSQ